MSDRRKANAAYYARTRDRVIMHESELRPSTILDLIECLSDLDFHPADKHIGRLKALYQALTGGTVARIEPGHTKANTFRAF